MGSYAISGSGLSAANYVFAQSAVNSAALTITPTTLAYLAGSTSLRLWQRPIRRWGGTVTGFLNGDTQASATTGTLTFATSATSLQQCRQLCHHRLGPHGSANYVFIQDPGNALALTITPAVLTYLANSASRTYGSANPALSGTVTGFVNGDTQAGATSGTLSFASAATASAAMSAFTASHGAGLTASQLCLHPGFDQCLRP